MPDVPPVTPEPDPEAPGLRVFPAARDHAVRELAGMFDDVSGRYDLLNSMMTLGQDRAWRAAMWRAVPETAGVVLDLCTGTGVSLDGLRRPGRVLLGVDASLRMLELAADEHGPWGWAPRLACADAFRLPFRDGALDAVTIAFGMRNLRPRAGALAELARVLAPGGTLVVLEATAPRPGPLAPLHRFYARRVIPLLGRLSPDPVAYRYLSESIFDFGAGEEFEHDLTAGGFEIVERQAYHVRCSPLVGRPEAGRGGRRDVAKRPVQGRWSGQFHAGWPSLGTGVALVDVRSRDRLRDPDREPGLGPGHLGQMAVRHPLGTLAGSHSLASHPRRPGRIRPPDPCPAPAIARPASPPPDPMGMVAHALRVPSGF